MKTIKIKITKVQELPDALHPNNVEEGYTNSWVVDKKSFREPTLGERFNIGYFSTSGVQEIIDSNTFRTYSSIYKWEIIS